MKNITQYILESQDPMKEIIDYDLSDLYEALQSDGMGTVEKLAGIKERIEETFDENLKLSDKEIKDIFGKYINNIYETGELSSTGYSGPMEQAFFDTWGENNDYVDSLPGRYMHEGKEDGDYVTASWGVDDNGIFMVMFEDEGDHNMIFMTYIN
jgi:hypothetical protein